jgi:NADPH-dependent 2,4-dienoyl-CoA reductase/sulfur reductase-like enzyme
VVGLEPCPVHIETRHAAQGRIAADNIAGRDSKFRGTQGTAVVGLFGLTIASTGALRPGESVVKNRLSGDISVPHHMLPVKGCLA